MQFWTRLGIGLAASSTTQLILLIHSVRTYINPPWITNILFKNLWIAAALEQQTLEAAKEAYRTNTCLRLVERTNERNYVIIRKTGGGYWNIQINSCINNFYTFSSKDALHTSECSEPELSRCHWILLVTAMVYFSRLLLVYMQIFSNWIHLI